MLAPHSRGIITFHEHKVSKDSILELQNFSHVFVVFVFHLNSNTAVRQNTFHDKKTKQGKRQFPSKIAPPSLGGKKVGVFSTRTPHRPNPIGFSLCKLDRVIVNNNKKGDSSFSLLLSGLDIVDGTPILDIKPYVPHYDCVGYNARKIGSGLSQFDDDNNIPQTLRNGPNIEPRHGSDVTSIQNKYTEEVRVPYWVDSGLQKRRNVTFLQQANQFLQDLIPTNSAKNHSFINDLQFYGPNSPWNDSPSEAVECLTCVIHELLSVDVRSAWQTKKARKGQFQAEKSSRVKEWKGENIAAAGTNGNDDTESNPLCTQQLDNVLLQFSIEAPDSALLAMLDERSKGSGAEDIVAVHSISIINANEK